MRTAAIAAHGHRFAPDTRTDLSQRGTAPHIAVLSDDARAPPARHGVHAPDPVPVAGGDHVRV